MNSFSLGKNRSHLEPGQCIWSQVSSSTGCHPKCRLWTTPSPAVFAIRVCIYYMYSTYRNNHFP